MEPQPFTTPPSPAGSKSPLKVVLLILAALVMAVLGAAGGYVLRGREAASGQVALQAKITKLQADLKTQTETSNANAAKAQVVAKQSLITISEMDLRLAFDDKLKGLTYVFGKQKTDQGDLNVVQFSSQAILNNLSDIPSGGGQKWYVGNLLSAYFVDNRADPPTDYEKAHLIKDFGDKRLIELIPQSGPFADKGFEAYNNTYNSQHPLLLEALKKAELIKN